MGPAASDSQRLLAPFVSLQEWWCGQQHYFLTPFVFLLKWIR